MLFRSKKTRKKYDGIIDSFTDKYRVLFEALYLAAQCRQLSGDEIRAFNLLEKLYEFTRWASPDFKYKVESFKDLLTIYRRLIAADIKLKSPPPWALILDPDNPVIKGPFTDEEKYQYTLIPLGRKYFIQAPAGLGIKSLVTRAEAVIETVPAFYGLDVYPFRVSHWAERSVFSPILWPLSRDGSTATVSPVRTEEVELPDTPDCFLLRVKALEAEMKEWEVRVELVPISAKEGRVEEARKKNVIIETLPAESRISLNDRNYENLYGKVRLSLEAGDYKVKITHPGFPAIEDEITLEKGEDLHLLYDLTDRKSTRLNSSHIPYLVCRLLLEKKK